MPLRVITETARHVRAILDKSRILADESTGWEAISPQAPILLDIRQVIG